MTGRDISELCVSVFIFSVDIHTELLYMNSKEKEGEKENHLSIYYHGCHYHYIYMANTAAAMTTTTTTETNKPTRSEERRRKKNIQRDIYFFGSLMANSKWMRRLCVYCLNMFIIIIIEWEQEHSHSSMDVG